MLIRLFGQAEMANRRVLASRKKPRMVVLGHKKDEQISFLQSFATYCLVIIVTRGSIFYCAEKINLPKKC
jgi:hypothetical protein